LLLSSHHSSFILSFYCSQGTVRKAAGWDFPDRSEGTGTVRVGSRPPQISSTKDGRSGAPRSPNTPTCTSDRENQWRTSWTGSDKSLSSSLSQREARSEHGKLESCTEDVRFSSIWSITWLWLMVLLRTSSLPGWPIDKRVRNCCITLFKNISIAFSSYESQF
jgi:hypothetical protein